MPVINRQTAVRLFSGSLSVSAKIRDFAFLFENGYYGSPISNANASHPRVSVKRMPARQRGVCVKAIKTPRKISHFIPVSQVRESDLAFSNVLEMIKACNCLSYRLFQRKERDSNPRYDKRTTVFETVPIYHSGIFP